ncbi:hypothetical protein J3P88_28610 [Pseudomonas sp. Z3-6]|uniref:hypothetical protein n=1 Tax=Pseudomonas sp. Z3-6 TaxID=2817411 RepID=UPI003DA84DC8
MEKEEDQLKNIGGSLPASFGTFALDRTMPVSLGAAASAAAEQVPEIERLASLSFRRGWIFI